MPGLCAQNGDFTKNSNLPRKKCPTYVHLCTQNGDLTKKPNQPGKKCPCEYRGGEGEGVQKLFGQCPNVWANNLRGASLGGSEALEENILLKGPFFKNLTSLRPGKKTPFFSFL